MNFLMMVVLVVVPLVASTVLITVGLGGIENGPDAGDWRPGKKDDETHVMPKVSGALDTPIKD